MSYVIATPDLVESAANDLAGIRSSLAEAAATAAGPTTGIATAAQDEISVAIASLFGNFGQDFQALSAQAQAFHQQFVALMNAGAGAYVSAEAANAGQVLGGGIDGGIVGTVGEGLGGAVAGGQTTLGQLSGGIGQGLNGAVTALQNGSISALVGGEIQTGAQAISNAIAGAPITLGALPTGGAPGLLGGINSFGTAVAAPYQALVSNTVTNLQAINATFSANPFPFLHQIVNNQIGYGQTIAASIATGIQNLPAELASLPAAVQSGIQGLATVNPGAALQQFVNNQIGYAQTVTTALQSAGRDLVTGAQSLPGGFQTAFQFLLVGDNAGAYGALNQGLVSAFLPGFHDVTLDLGLPPQVVPIIPLGPLGDLAPIFSIPGQMAQNFTTLLPAGSIPAQMAQNFTNVLDALTNFGTTLSSADLAINFGLPLQFAFDAVGAPVNALSALNSSAVSFTSALQTGDVAGAAAAVLDAPAVVANGFLNGQTLIDLPPLTANLLFDGVQFGSLTSTTQVPLGGLLTPLSPLILAGVGGGPLPGTPIGGFIPGLLSFGSQLAAVVAPLT